MNLKPICPDSKGPDFKSIDTVALLSGGLDSTVALAEVLHQGASVFCLTFNYGQRAWEREDEATKALALHYSLPHEVISLPWLADLLPAALMPQERLSLPETPVTEETLFETSRVWVPNRNGVFLNIAAAYAEAKQAKNIIFGANADEAVGFPDNTQAYRDKLTEAFAYSTLNQVRVETPVGTMTKAEIIQRAIELAVPLNIIWSCYEGLQHHCGACPSCLLLKKAFMLSGRHPAVQFQG